MFLDQKRKEYASLSEAPAFVQEQFNEYVYWTKKLRSMQDYISKKLEKKEEAMEIMHANYNDLLIRQSYDIENEIFHMTQIISKQLNCLSQDEIKNFLQTELSGSYEVFESQEKNKIK